MQLYVFSVDPGFVHDVVAAGAAGVVVDWECRGKARRQEGQDTEINRHTPRDLERVRAATGGRVLCRVNAYGPWTSGEVEAAVARGADELLLPMVRRPEEVDRTLELVDGRCGLGILVETRDAVARVAELARRPLSRLYVGLNDLRIDRGATDLFTPLLDGTVDAVRAAVDVPFGVAGLTLPGRGDPVPTELLAAELDRIGAAFTFLRRSFLADLADRDPAVEIPRMHAACDALRGRTPAQVRADRAELVALHGRLARPAAPLLPA
ncbi:aldolase [Actinomycetospora sp. TBRC 11914]|uniref:aldolase n=1 Tax=Actinomycetospora sp. TBRC 11914 TaxID=2729387 RepID=UPI00145E1AFC|nr:aldolase [Actinomycetospora sp. TBRC 11914]NMO88240.1 aldolase [Actinomycetospora sp. TBRC 11914]